MDSVGSGVNGDVPEMTWTVAQLNHEIETVLTDAHDRFPSHVVREIVVVDVRTDTTTSGRSSA